MTALEHRNFEEFCQQNGLSCTLWCSLDIHRMVLTEWPMQISCNLILDSIYLPAEPLWISHLQIHNYWFKSQKVVGGSMELSLSTPLCLSAFSFHSTCNFNSETVECCCDKHSELSSHFSMSSLTWLFIHFYRQMDLCSMLYLYLVIFNFHDLSHSGNTCVILHYLKHAQLACWEGSCHVVCKAVFRYM